MSILMLRTALIPKKSRPATRTKMVIGFRSAVLINPIVCVIQLKFIKEQSKISAGRRLVQQGLPDIVVGDIRFRFRLVEEKGRRRDIDDIRQPVFVKGLLL